MILKLFLLFLALLVAFAATVFLGLFFFGKKQIMVWKRELEKGEEPQNTARTGHQSSDKDSVEVQYQVIKEEEI